MKKAIVKFPAACGDVVHHMKFGELRDGDIVDVPDEMDFDVEQYFFPAPEQTKEKPRTMKARE